MNELQRYKETRDPALRDAIEQHRQHTQDFNPAETRKSNEADNQVATQAVKDYFRNVDTYSLRGQSRQAYHSSESWKTKYPKDARSQSVYDGRISELQQNYGAADPFALHEVRSDGRTWKSQRDAQRVRERTRELDINNYRHRRRQSDLDM